MKSNLEELCQWMSAALHDEPAQKLLHRRILNPHDPNLGPALDAVGDLMHWLRSPILEGLRLSQALEDWLVFRGYRADLSLDIATAPRRVEQILYRIFQELAELRLPLGPTSLSVGLHWEGTNWRALWCDNAVGPVAFRTIPERVSSLGARYRFSYTDNFRLEIRFKAQFRTEDSLRGPTDGLSKLGGSGRRQKL